MKRFSAILIVVIFAVTTISAQFNYGITAGMNISKVSVSNMDLSANNRTGWFVGPKAEFMIPIIGLGIDASLQYSQRYLSVESQGTSDTKKYQSIEIPINVRYQFGLSSLAALFVSTGPQFGFNIGSGSWTDIKTAGSSENLNLKKSCTTWNIGVGAKLLKHIELGVGYNFSLGKIGEKMGVESGSIKANTWQLQATYLF